MISNGKDTSSWAQEVSQISRTAMQYDLHAVQDIVSPPQDHVLQLPEKTQCEDLCVLQAGTFMSLTLSSVVMKKPRCVSAVWTLLPVPECCRAVWCHASLSAAAGGLLHRNADPRHR